MSQYTVTGAAPQPLTVGAALELMSQGVWNAVVTLWDAIVHAAIGWALVGPLGIYLLYRLLEPALRRASQKMTNGNVP